MKLLKTITVHAVPVGVGGEAESAVGLLAAAAATEKTAGVAGDLVAGDGNVLEDALLDGVVVRIKGGDGELHKKPPRQQKVAGRLNELSRKVT